MDVELAVAAFEIAAADAWVSGSSRFPAAGSEWRCRRRAGGGYFGHGAGGIVPQRQFGFKLFE